MTTYIIHCVLDSMEFHLYCFMFVTFLKKIYLDMMIYVGNCHFNSDRLDFLSLCFFLTVAHGRVISDTVRLKNRHMFACWEVQSRAVPPAGNLSVYFCQNNMSASSPLCWGLKRGESQRYFVFNKCESLCDCVSVLVDPWGRCYWCHLNVYWSAVINGRSVICNSVPGLFFFFLP